MQADSKRKSVNGHGKSMHAAVSNVACSTHFAHSSTHRSTAHLHALHADSCWLEPTTVWCWHCCHPFEGSPVYVPTAIKTVSDDDATFEVYGNFCSFPCARAYLAERPHFNSHQEMVLLNKMAIDVYGQDVPIRLAPPRICLSQFGGNMSLAEFRQAHVKRHITCTYPPFSAGKVVVNSSDVNSNSAEDQRSGVDSEPLDATAEYRDGAPAPLSDPSSDAAQWSVRNIRRPHTADDTKKAEDPHGFMRFVKSKS